MRTFLTTLACGILASGANAVETEITVLAVNSSGSGVTTILDAMDYLQQQWPGSGNVTIRLANGGVPVVLNVGGAGSTAISQLNTVVSHPSWPGIRDSFGADVMLVFTRSIASTECGRAIQYNWTSIDDPIPGLFSPNTQGLDLNGSEDSYYAISSTASNCPILVAAHEFGHLLGGGHTFENAPNRYLKSDSHALAQVIQIPPIPPFFPNGLTIGTKTILAEGANPVACSNSPYGAVECVYIDIYSNVPGSTDNQGTFTTTARSVANYRTPQTSGGPGGCGLSTPVFVTGYLVAYCSPPPWSQHVVTWVDICPSASDFYQVWYSQPDGYPYRYGWNSFITSTPYYVYGAHSRARIRSCSGSSCTGLSTSSYLALSGC